jgi:hypothetical protein
VSIVAYNNPESERAALRQKGDPVAARQGLDVVPSSCDIDGSLREAYFG